VRLSSNEPITADLIVRRKRWIIAQKAVELDEAGTKRVAIPLTRLGRNKLKGKEAVGVNLIARTRDLALNRRTARARAALD
jgi:hypothetical protein